MTKAQTKPGFKPTPKPKSADDFIKSARTHTKAVSSDDLTRSSFQLPRALLRKAKIKAAGEGTPIAEILRQALEAYVGEK